MKTITINSRDEPFSGLDGKAIDKVTNILVSLSQTDEYKTIVW